MLLLMLLPFTPFSPILAAELDDVSKLVALLIVVLSGGSRELTTGCEIGRLSGNGDTEERELLYGEGLIDLARPTS